MADKKQSKIEVDTGKEIKEIAQKIRPDKNSVVLQDGSNLEWNVKPGKKKTKFGLEFKKNFITCPVKPRPSGRGYKGLKNVTF